MPEKTSEPCSKGHLNIYGYTNYRTYLKDFFEHKKKNKAGYSYRVFAREAKLSSPNYLKLLIDGKRNLGEKTIPNIIQALGLEGNMGEYFTNLVKMNHTSCLQKKEHYLHHIKSLTPLVHKRKLGLETHRFLSHWINPVLTEMVEMSNFKADPYWITKKMVLDSPLKTISQSWQFLLESGFVEKIKTGGFKVKDKVILSSDEIKNMAVQRFHLLMLDTAKKVLGIVPIDKREYRALTIRVSENSVKELKEKLKKFHDDIHVWSLEQQESSKKNNEKEIVLQLNMQMFPFTDA